MDELKKRILVVEDDAPLRDLYVKILGDAGYAVDAATDGEQGYASMYAGGYDLVLLDIILPKMDGLAILKKLAAEQVGHPPKKIVVLSNLGQDDVVAQAMSQGAVGYMIKSDYTPDQIVAQVKSFLEGK